MKTLIVSPTYNESKNIAELIRKVNEINHEYHLLIVDDNSPDGTGDIIEELQHRLYPNVHLARRPGKAGLGTAYKFGFKWALERDYDVIVQMDADGSHDANDIPDMILALDNHDVIIGSRYIHGVRVVNWPIRRLILSYGANVYSKIITGMPLKDATAGFKVWKREVLESIDLDSIRSQGYSFQIEMNFRAWQKGYSIVEHPVIFIDRTVGKSKMSKAIMIEAIFMVWRLRIWKLFGWYK